MSDKVVDASALGALLFGEPEAEAVARRLSGARLAAPALLPFELANIALKKIRRHPDLRAALMTAFDKFERMAIEVIAVDYDGVINLAERRGLTAYDASYLWLARVLDADLVTLDRSLAAASQARGTSEVPAASRNSASRVMERQTAMERCAGFLSGIWVSLTLDFPRRRRARDPASGRVPATDA
jgi:predicted nucleic acid-binding protein